MKNMWIIVVLSLLSGCGYNYAYKTRGGEKITDPQIISQIEINKSSKIDVERILGKSSAITTDKNGNEIWTYMSTQGKVGLFGSTAKNEFLIIIFGENGLVKRIHKQGNKGTQSLF